MGEAPARSIFSGLPKRLATGLVFGLTLLGITWIGGWALFGFLFLLAWMSNRELHGMYANRGIHLNLAGMQLSSALCFASWEWLTSPAGRLTQPGALVAPYFAHGGQLVLFCGLLCMLVPLLFRGEPRASMAEISAAAWVVFYCGWLPAHWLAVRNLTPDKFGYDVFVTAASCVIAVDTGAYLAGKLLGRHPFFPEVSPKKTVEGAVGGVVAPLLIAALLAGVFGLPLLPSLAMAVLVSVGGQFGDLLESLLKRDAGVKDSGATIPGHGGLLDRADSFIFTGAVSYYFWVFGGS